MKKALLSLILAASSAWAFANPLTGTWQTYDDGEAKAQVLITQAGETFTGKIVFGNTEKAKKYVGKTVLYNLKSTGSNTYKGKAKDPRWGLSVGADITVNGNTLNISTFKGKQTWKKLK